MRIACVGTHCLGKSTFIKDFRRVYKTYKTPTTTYRQMAKSMDLPLNTDAKDYSQRMILDSLMQQVARYADHLDVIHDRSPLDALMYSYSVFSEEEFFLASTDVISAMNANIDHILFFPLHGNTHIKLEEKDQRLNDVKYRWEIDRRFTNFLGVNVRCLPAITYITGNRERRMKQVAQIIK